MLRRGKFTKEEDQAIIDHAAKNKGGNWPELAKILHRNQNSLSERWRNYLKPGLNKNAWNEEEDKLLINLYRQYGPKWSRIAKFFSGRTNVNCKNRWAVIGKHPPSIATESNENQPLKQNDGIAEIGQDKEFASIFDGIIEDDFLLAMSFDSH
ncbi:Myb-like DNA-binding domain containing protein [Trichomonas vaginalis G3]|uniref:Myb-like DNA-binding domain containing protein n=1 Tax=Trichomonas vaginalis (strain ATCC PRA-98 / G3) TaxID=412133 RepID=A2ELG8_TRIV3|nr:RNA polymerase II transcription regulator recruiting protein [Trichomonas vaginalis G3]EAY06495.1 Myb-like DNA-binding domain containing protein [Trichomonas vaginalis G3]KAI5538870.1 RNA polymerase II transcription regulator recruiting protein [Trichomonas vaginalis G3]|eukprot:XP_001318718.1 Myb-like DNA-binding domain containing protein [Trichomonas vaginalis G3]